MDMRRIRKRIFRIILILVPLLMVLSIVQLFTQTSEEIELKERVEGEHSIRNKMNYTSLYHEYERKVDFRIIVMTFNRAQSLSLCLESLQGMYLDGHSTSLDIWIDRDADSMELDGDTVSVASAFRWTAGPVTVWLHSRHVGLIGQWLYTWRPLPGDNSLVMFVEDDVDVSPYAYRWLRAAYVKYGSRDDVTAITVQDENAVIARAKKYNLYSEVPKPHDAPAYLYRLPGTWAMAPVPSKWRQFQDWFEGVKTDPSFRPYLPEAKFHNAWFKVFEAKHEANNMWSMWFIHYMYHNHLFCVYSNLPVYSQQLSTSLSANRKVAGLHYTKDMKTKIPKLLLEGHWDASFIDFLDKPIKFDFDGSVLK